MIAVVCCCCAYEGSVCVLCAAGEHAECRRIRMAENGWRARPADDKKGA